jgi:hypothetical protein
MHGNMIKKPLCNWGVVVSAGPNGEADFTDARYWVASAFIANDERDGPNALLRVKPYAVSHPLRRVVVVTNLCERQASICAGEMRKDETHRLDMETVVRFESCRDDDGGSVRHWMTASPTKPTSSPDAGHPRNLLGSNRPPVAETPLSGDGE